MKHPDLIEGRSCGTCMVCCVVPGIDEKEVQKQFNTACKHCQSGCRIYEQRPDVCRKFHCAWRYFAEWDEPLRPDISGVFARIEPSPDGPGFAVSILLMEKPREIAQTPWFGRHIGDLAAAGVPLYLGLPGAPGHRPIRVSLTREALTIAIRQKNMAPLLLNAIGFMQAQPPVPHRLVHSGNDLTAHQFTTP